MATKQLEVQTVIAQRDDIGAVDSKDFDETTTLASFLLKYSTAAVFESERGVPSAFSM